MFRRLIGFLAGTLCTFAFAPPVIADQQTLTMSVSSIAPPVVNVNGGSATMSVNINLSAPAVGEDAPKKITYQSFSVQPSDGTVTNVACSGLTTRVGGGGSTAFAYSTDSLDDQALSYTMSVTVSYSNSHTPGDKPISLSGQVVIDGSTINATVSPTPQPMHVIGGTYSMATNWNHHQHDGDMLLTCDGTATTVDCYGVPGQPAGTTFAWSFVSGGSEANLSNTSSIGTTVSPVSPSSSLGEISLRLTYSLMGYTAVSTQTMTVHEPARPPSSRANDGPRIYQGLASNYPSGHPESPTIQHMGATQVGVCILVNVYTVKSKAGMLLPYDILWHETNSSSKTTIQGDIHTDASANVYDMVGAIAQPHFSGANTVSDTDIHKVWLSGCGPLWNSTETIYNTPSITQVLNN